MNEDTKNKRILKAKHIAQLSEKVDKLENIEEALRYYNSYSKFIT